MTPAAPKPRSGGALDSALTLAAQGFRVFPLAAGTSVPPKGFFKFQDQATTDPNKIREFWKTYPDANVGVATGRGLIVIDVDVKKGKKGAESLDALEALGLPTDGYRVKTPSGGVHVFLRTEHPHRQIIDSLDGFPGIDIKCEGNYVVGAGSTRRDFPGKPYQQTGPATIPAMPAWLDDIIVRSSPKRTERTEQPLVELDKPSNVANAIEYLEKRAPEAIEGAGGDTTTFQVAARMRDYGLSDAKAWELMLDHWNERKAAPPWEPEDLLAKVQNAYAYGTGAWGGEDPVSVMDEVEDVPLNRDQVEIDEPANDNGCRTARHPDPVDLWGKFEPPTLPRGLLPALIENFAFDESRIMGADPAGLALSALCVCAAAIPDQIKIQVKEHHSGWVESARLWVVLVGQPSSKKSPILRAAARPLREIDNKLVQQYILQKEQFDKLSKEDKKTTRPPRQPRTLIEDVTVEAAIDVLKDNPGGVLCYQDELSSWLGAMDKYAGGRGSQKDRGIWLQAYNGGPYSTNRISRGAAYIPNLSVTLLGGVQPDAIRKVAAEGVDDGLIQRFLPILLRPAEIGTDDADTPAAKSYLTAVRNLREISGALDETPETEETVTLSPTMLRFSPEAQGVRKKMEAYLHEMQILEDMSPKLAAHLNKFDGVFARLCVVWHCLENNEKAVLPPIVQEETAKRVFAFITDFLLRHSIAFYMSTLDFTEHTDVVLACAGHILAHPEKKEISARDFRRGDKLMGSLPTNADRERTLEKLEFLGWVTAVASRTPRDAARWEVNPEVHRQFAKRAEKEASRRQEIRKLLAEMREGVA